MRYSTSVGVGGSSFSGSALTLSGVGGVGGKIAGTLELNANHTPLYKAVSS